MQLAAAIIETRLDKLITAIPAHLRWLPDTTQLHVFTDASHREAVCEQFPTAYVHTVTITPAYYFRDLNAIMTTATFWNVFAPADRVLIFQHDSGILRYGIEEFYQWDYIGAPFGPAYPFVGNGGFSLRNPRAMAHICGALHYSPYLPEDTFFPIGCDMLGYSLATTEAAMRFSCEIHHLMGTFGYHAIDRYLTPEQVRQIKTQYDTLTVVPPDTQPTLML